MAERLAVADLGSNSFRLVVFAASAFGGGDPAPWWRRTDEIYEAVRIGEGLVASGRLGDEGMARGLATIDVFAHFCAAAGLHGDEIDVVATSAIRDAENAEEFLAHARERSALAIRVLTREQEARYGYLAAVNSTTLADGAMLDLGGGSLQLARVESRAAAESASWPFGALRMTERFLAGDGPAKPKQLRDLRAHVARKLERAGWPASTGSRVVGVGGTVRNLAAAAQRDLGVPEFGVQGYVLGRAELGALVERFAALAPAERGRVPGIKPSRGDLILAGAVVVDEVLAQTGADGIEVTEAGLREGVMFERLIAGDGSLVGDVRRSSVLNLAARYAMTPQESPHVAHVAKLALSLFDEIASAGLHSGDPVERELLWAAAVLHDIGMTIDYDDHHKHSRYLILNGGLPGFEPREVALIGQAVRYHRKGIPSLGPFEPLAIDGDAERVQRMSLLLRLAEDLERSRDQLVREAHMDVVDGTVTLRLVSTGDDRVPRWAAGREVELFERTFGRALTVAGA